MYFFLTQYQNGIILRAGTKHIIELDAGEETTGYPLKVKTVVETSDPELNAVWDISLRTLKRCMHETYEDCPFYEQLQYAMDTRAQILFTYYISGDDRLARKCIDDFHRSLRPDGLTNCCYPSTGPNVIPGFSLYYIFMIHDHMMFYGDKELVERYLHTAERILQFFESKRGADGLASAIKEVSGDATCSIFGQCIRDSDNAKRGY